MITAERAETAAGMEKDPNLFTAEPAEHAERGLVFRIQARDLDPSLRSLRALRWIRVGGGTAEDAARAERSLLVRIQAEIWRR
jgi:hypothetical protein